MKNYTIIALAFKQYSALKAVKTIRHAQRGGYEYVADLDIMSFFNEIKYNRG